MPSSQPHKIKKSNSIENTKYRPSPVRVLAHFELSLFQSTKETALLCLSCCIALAVFEFILRKAITL